MSEFDEPADVEPISLHLMEGHLQVLHLEPGDVLVLQCDDQIPRANREILRQDIEEAFPGFGRGMLILDAGRTLGVVRRRKTDGGTAGG